MTSPARHALALLHLACLCSCMVGPDFKKPDPVLPDRWSVARDPEHTLKPVSGEELSTWWKGFNDPLLEHLIREAQRQNLDLRIAFSRIDQARAEQSATRSDLFPSVSGTGKVARVSNLLPFETPLMGDSFNYFLTGFDTFWEIDVFGRLRRKLEAAEAMTKASAEEHREAFIVLAAEIGRVYVHYRGLQHQEALLEERRKLLEESVRLHAERVNHGLETRDLLAQNESSAARVLAETRVVEADLVTSRHELEELVGKKPNALLGPLSRRTPLPKADVRRLLTQPAKTLELRPDVRAAELGLRAATARQGAALAELFPKVSIAAFIGLRNSDLENLFRSSSFAWATGSSISQPIFNFGQIRAGINLAEARQQEAYAAYEKTVISALHECESAMSEFLKAEKRREDLYRSVIALETAAHLADIRFEQGLETRQDSLKHWLGVNEEKARLIEAESAVSTRLIALYKAIGGGDGTLEAPILEDPLRPWG